MKMMLTAILIFLINNWIKRQSKQQIKVSALQETLNN